MANLRPRYTPPTPKSTASPPAAGPNQQSSRPTVAGKQPRKTVAGKGILKRTPQTRSRSRSQKSPTAENSADDSSGGSEELVMPTFIPLQTRGSILRAQKPPPPTPRAGKLNLGKWDSDWSSSQDTSEDTTPEKTPTPPASRAPKTPSPPRYIINVRARKAQLKPLLKADLVALSESLNLDVRGLRRTELEAQLMVYPGPILALSSERADIDDDEDEDDEMEDALLEGPTEEEEEPANMAQAIVQYVQHEERQTPGVSAAVVRGLAEKVGLGGEWVEAFEKALGGGEKGLEG